MEFSRAIPLSAFIVSLLLAFVVGALMVCILVSFAQTPFWCGNQPTDAVCVREWVSALGGWAAALVVVPTIVLLVRQNNHAGEQARQARLPALSARAEMLREEFQFVERFIPLMLNSEISIMNTAIAHADDDTAEFIAHMNNQVSGLRIMIEEAKITAVTYQIQNPNRRIIDFRKKFISSTGIFVIFFNEFSGIFEESLKEGADFDDIRDRLEDRFSSFVQGEARPKISKAVKHWRLVVAAELRETYSEINALSGIQDAGKEPIKMPPAAPQGHEPYPN